MERMTRQRDAIRETIDAAKRPLSLNEVLTLAQQAVPGLGMATVYRNVKLLVAEGAVQSVSLSGQAPRYEAAGEAHHHHFQCTACDRMFDVHQCPGDLKKLAPRGFLVESHELTLYGRCIDCRKHRH